ncbi:hypothetical protein G3N95_31735 [Paraburkholderia sp. Tr-20389]|uniref:hypothetical protein n=1 Tax=Paraburkholderia sp. Tr-20389 TaxID=2703903 RepID=UPI001980B605|nr:hypothetical protein [Paraburkholderia sp. Tr-20389]MBN3757534.1 hypothetical protein [Paraburkholderia sp. Tr-20389]
MKRTLIAAAVLAAASSSVFASPLKNPFIFNATLVGEAVGIEGFVTLFGCVGVSSTAGAVVNNTQHAYGNASISPNAQSYTSGSVTTRIDNSYKSIDGGGKAWASLSTSHSSESYSAQGYQASAGYKYGEQSSSVKGGGFEFSAQAAAIEGGFSHESQNSGGHISAGGHASGSYEYASHNTPWKGSGYASVQGGLSAGYKESSYSNSEHVSGGFAAVEASGQGKVWGYQAKQGSGYVAYGEQSSGYDVEKSKTHDSMSAQWGFSSSVSKTDVEVYGSVTQHINTQKAGTLTATTGANAATNVSGNIGVNIAEGVNNAQSNDAALASVDAGNVFGNAQVFNTQSSGGKAKINNFNVNASVGDGSLQYASGNVGVNVASGISNVQNNSMAASTSTVSRNHGSAAMVATDDSSQSAGVDFRGSFEGTASLGAGALSHATGNIGVNIAGGAGNVQHNGLAIASMNTSR